ncbi:MAG: hypothetical protein ACTHLO_08640 [Pseudolabrys sp.]
MDEHALRLRAYLVALTPQARRGLRDALEAGVARGADAEALAELRRLDIDDAAATSFFQPLDPFLIDDDTVQAYPGCIARASLPALWAWIANDLVPQETAAFTAALSAAHATGATAQTASLTHAFQERVAVALRTVFGDGAAARAALLRRIGTPRADSEAATLRWALRGRDTLAALGERLPATIADLPPHHVPACIALIEDAARPRDVLPYAIVLVMRRLAQPWQIVRLAAHKSGANSAARIEATPYGVVIDMLLAALERQIAALSAALAEGDGAAAVVLIRSVDATIRGLHGEIAIPVGSTLGRRLQALSAEAAAMTRSAIAA